MYAISLLQGMVFYEPVATLYRQVQGVSIFQITLIESISLILCILLEIPWGMIADKIGYHKTMIFCCVFYFISKIKFWQAAGFIWFLVERIMLSVVLAGLLTVISYGTAAFFSFGLVEVKSEESSQFSIGQFKEVFIQTLKNKNLLLFLLFTAFLTETHQTITVFLNQLQYEKYGLGNSAIGYLYIAATLLGTFGFFSSWFTKKTGIRMTGILLGSAAIISCIMLILANSALLSVCGILLLRITNSLFGPFQSRIQNEQIHTSNRATALSIHAMFIDSVGIGTNLVFGSLAEKDLTMSYFFGAFICTIGVLLFICWLRTDKKHA